jgi:hypothetical protein
MHTTLENLFQSRHQRMSDFKVLFGLFNCCHCDWDTKELVQKNIMTLSIPQGYFLITPEYPKYYSNYS